MSRFGRMGAGFGRLGNSSGSGPDVTVPTVVSLSPSNGATEIAADTDFVVTFNEPIFEGDDFHYELWEAGAEAATVIWTAADLGTSASISGAAVTLEQAVVVLTPADTFYILQGATAVKDAAGNHAAAIPESEWEFTIDTTAPVLSAADINDITETTATFGFVSDEAGTYYVVTTTSTTEPSKAQIKAGQDHTGTPVGAGLSANGAAVVGLNSVPITGATAETVYYTYGIVEDAAGNQSNIVFIDAWETSAASAPGPVILDWDDDDTNNVPIFSVDLDASGLVEDDELHFYKDHVLWFTYTITAGDELAGVFNVEDPSGDALEDDTYDVYVRGENGNGLGDQSNEEAITVATGLLAPIITITSGNDPDLTADLDADISAGDEAEIQYDTNADFSTATSAFNEVDAGEDAANALTFSGIGPLADGTWYVRARVHVGGVGGIYTPWSASDSTVVAALVEGEVLLNLTNWQEAA